jgi:hypothetical protein
MLKFLNKVLILISISMFLVLVFCSAETFKNYVKTLWNIVAVGLILILTVLIAIKILLGAWRDSLKDRFKIFKDKLKASFEQEKNQKNKKSAYLLWFEQDLFETLLGSFNKNVNSRRRFIVAVICYFLFLLVVLCVTLFLK